MGRNLLISISSDSKRGELEKKAKLSDAKRKSQMGEDLDSYLVAERQGSASLKKKGQKGCRKDSKMSGAPQAGTHWKEKGGGGEKKSLILEGKKPTAVRHRAWISISMSSGGQKAVSGGGRNWYFKVGGGKTCFLVRGVHRDKGLSAGMRKDVHGKKGRRAPSAKERKRHVRPLPCSVAPCKLKKLVLKEKKGM